MNTTAFVLMVLPLFSSISHHLFTLFTWPSIVISIARRFGGQFVIAAALLFIVATGTKAQVVRGDADFVMASGSYVENHEGVSVFCVHATTAAEVVKGNSAGVCYMTEVQALAKESVFVATNVMEVQDWDQNGVTAITSFYAAPDGTETTAANPKAIKFTLRLVISLKAHTAAKFLESGAKTLGYHLGT
jgi:hypothetical protein